MASLSLRGTKGLVLHYVDDDDDTEDEEEDIAEANRGVTNNNSDDSSENPVEVAWNVCRKSPKLYDRLKGEQQRGDFRLSQDGRCPGCRSRCVLFVILDNLFPMGDMPEFLLHLMSRGQAVLWSSQESSRCKAPPTFLCHGYCPSDPIKSGFNINWQKVDLSKIFIHPPTDADIQNDELEMEEDLKASESQAKEDKDNNSIADSISSFTNNDDEINSGDDSDSEFDECIIDIDHYRKVVSWVVLDNITDDIDAEQADYEDKLIRTMLAIAEARDDWTNNILRVGPPTGTATVADENNDCSTANTSIEEGEIVEREDEEKEKQEEEDDDMNVKTITEEEDNKGEHREGGEDGEQEEDEEEDEDEDEEEEEEDDEEQRKQKAKEAEERLLQEKVASLFGPSSRPRPVLPVNRATKMNRMSALIAQQYDNIASQMAAKSKVVATITPTTTPSSSVEISRKPVTYVPNQPDTQEGDLPNNSLSSNVTTDAEMKPVPVEPDVEMNSPTEDSKTVTIDEESKSTDVKTLENSETDIKEDSEKDEKVENVDAKEEEVQYKASDFPVSDDGKCPYCQSFDVLYIILQYEDDDPDEELPEELNKLLEEGNAYKMKKGNTEPPSFQCKSCTYGFNLDWSSIELETVFANKAAAMSAKTEENTSSTAQSTVIQPAIIQGTSVLTTAQQPMVASAPIPQIFPRPMPPRHPIPGVGMVPFGPPMQQAALPPQVVPGLPPGFVPAGYRPQVQPGYPVGGYMPTAQPYAQQMPPGVPRGYPPTYPPMATPVYHQAWYPGYPGPPMVPVYPGMPPAYTPPVKKQKYTISVWHAPKTEVTTEKKPTPTVETRLVHKSSIIGSSENEEEAKDEQKETTGDSENSTTASSLVTAAEKTIEPTSDKPVNEDTPSQTKETTSPIDEVSSNSGSTTNFDIPTSSSPTDPLPPGVEPNVIEEISAENTNPMVEDEPLPPGIMPEDEQAPAISPSTRSAPDIEVLEAPPASTSPPLCDNDVPNEISNSITNVFDAEIVVSEDSEANVVDVKPDSGDIVNTEGSLDVDSPAKESQTGGESPVAEEEKSDEVIVTKVTRRTTAKSKRGRGGRGRGRGKRGKS